MSRYASLFQNAGYPDRGEPVESVAESATPSTFTVLFVDDEENVLNAMRRIFMEEDYTILTATSAEKGLAVMEREPVHLVVSDHRMPGMTGAEFLKCVKEKWPQTIRIMLTGHADVNSIMGAVKEGAVFKFITKPWNDEDLRLTVSLALQQYVLTSENLRLRELARTQSLKIKGYSSLFDENRGLMVKILLTAGVIRQEELERLGRESLKGEYLSDALVRLGITTEAKIIKAMQADLNIEFIDLREASISPAAARFLPRDLCERNRMLPVKLEGRTLTIAMADPSDIYKVDNIAMMTGFKVVPLLASSSEILAAIKRVHGEGVGGEEGEEISDLEPLDEIDIVLDEDEGETNIQELIGSSGVPPVIRIVNAIISEAVRLHASDIHVEAKTKHTLVRYRIDGMLHAKIRIPAELHAAVVSRLKILAKMDIAERRRPQDGRITVKSGTRIVDMRISSLPTLNGEKVVMRILDKSAAIKGLDELGVLEDDLVKISAMIKRPQGVIITTGPTGSGKTTMLYSILAAMLDGSKNYETIEEPVEYFLEEANQVSVREKIGLTFAQILRATLRQDPDVILVGEMRDFDTADVAFKASLTGHMVLTTLHTNSSVASITRLMDMGIKPYIIASALEGIISQRLVRRICPECSVSAPPDPDLAMLLKIPLATLGERIRQGSGCDSCNHTGYRGRIGLFELFVMSEDYRHLISSAYRESELLEMARAAGMRTLIEDGVEKVRRGFTTLDELVRVIGPQFVQERSCEGCGRQVEAKFLYCPFCGGFRHNVCRSCKSPLEDNWIICPHCGVVKESP